MTLFVNAFVGGAGEWFTSAQPTSIGELLRDTPVITRRRLSIRWFWLSIAVNNIKKYKWCYFMSGCRIKVQQLIGMDISLKMMMQSWSLWSLRTFTCAPHCCTVHGVILGFLLYCREAPPSLLVKRPRWLFKRLEDYWAAGTRRRVDCLKVTAAFSLWKGRRASAVPWGPVTDN